MPANDLCGPSNDRLVTAPFLKVGAAASLYFLHLGITITVVPRLIEEHLGGNELDIGLSLAAFNLAAIAIRPGVARFGEQHHLRSMMAGGALLAGASTALIALVGSRWAMLPLRGLQGIGQAGLFVGAATLVNELAPSHRRAEAASYFSVAIFTGMGLGPVIGEAVVGDDRYALGLVVASCFSILAALASLAAPRNEIHQTARAAGEPRFHRGALLPGTVMAFGVAGFATFVAFVPTYSKTVGVANAGLVFATYSAVCLLIRIVGAKFPELDRVGQGGDGVAGQLGVRPVRPVRLAGPGRAVPGRKPDRSRRVVPVPRSSGNVGQPRSRTRALSA